MVKLRRFFVVLALLCVATVANAIELKGVASVNVTSDTAASAKSMAFGEATRQIIVDVLRQYVDVDALKEVVLNAKNSELSGLVLASSIDGEQTSDTTYAARISMTIDAEAARVWLDEKEIKHWLPSDADQNMFTVSARLSNGLYDWGQLNQIANTENLDLGTKNIFGNVVTLQMPSTKRGAFTIGVRGAGWKYADKDGVLHIWKQ